MACWQSVNMGRVDARVLRESQMPKPEVVAADVGVELYMLMVWSGWGTLSAKTIMLEGARRRGFRMYLCMFCAIKTDWRIKYAALKKQSLKMESGTVSRNHECLT